MPRPTDTLTRTLLAGLPDSNMVVLRKAPDPGNDVLTVAWRMRWERLRAGIPRNHNLGHRSG